eukprot:9912079-Prorocentrum_lima.AAC.1
MTSSLVGSEMCIRDSSVGHAPVCGIRWGVVDPWQVSGRTGTALSSCTPVSYTHLTLPTICSV